MGFKGMGDKETTRYTRAGANDGAGTAGLKGRIFRLAHTSSYTLVWSDVASTSLEAAVIVSYGAYRYRVGCPSSATKEHYSITASYGHGVHVHRFIGCVRRKGRFVYDVHQPCLCESDNVST